MHVDINEYINSCNECQCDKHPLNSGVGFTTLVKPIIDVLCPLCHSSKGSNFGYVSRGLLQVLHIVAHERYEGIECLWEDGKAGTALHTLRESSSKMFVLVGEINKFTPVHTLPAQTSLSY
ncbi:hypothetical protein PR048_012385 [Dryococelus australis]|uniref:Uncharacterized protein n=1 Tax=Dryococelus australis TaxID=614101 RepID=A0ABQ9HPZ8_9NEOP|nr:hypothetical protein PR048_012385 [Dryococelus australis]